MHHNFAVLLLSLPILLQAGKQRKMNLDKVRFIVFYVAARIIVIMFISSSGNPFATKKIADIVYVIL